MSCVQIKAQIPVREEPRHHPVLQNKYIRLLDVWIAPGDTTLFHIHETPSLFIILSNAVTKWQSQGEDWILSKDTAGKTWYRSFSPDVLIHRVANIDTVTYYVNDIELLSVYNRNNPDRLKPLPFPLLYENEKAFAYQLNNADPNNEVIKSRGPMIAELISGNGLNFTNTDTKQTIPAIAGKYLYIEPGKRFYFSKTVPGEINMVLFEIK
jgi:hypothetical protein